MSFHRNKISFESAVNQILYYEPWQYLKQFDLTHFFQYDLILTCFKSPTCIWVNHL